MKSRARKKRGFTLIELIVVLVIMAVLAAAAILTMMGYVEEAKGAQHVAEARIIYVAATAAYTEARGVYGAAPEGEQYIDFTPGQTHGEPSNAVDLVQKRVYEMCVAGLPYSAGGKSAWVAITGDKSGTVTKVEYQAAMALGETKRWVVTIETGPGGENTATWEKR